MRVIVPFALKAFKCTGEEKNAQCVTIINVLFSSTSTYSCCYFDMKIVSICRFHFLKGLQLHISQSSSNQNNLLLFYFFIIWVNFNKNNSRPSVFYCRCQHRHHLNATSSSSAKCTIRLQNSTKEMLSSHYK